MYAYLFADRDPVDEPGTSTGSPGDWWTVTALVPDAFDHIGQGIAFYRSEKRILSPHLRELGQLRVGYTQMSRFVWSQHCKACREMGWSEEKIQAVRAWQTSDLFEPIERALLAYADALVLEGGRVDDRIFDAMQAELSDEEILEFTYITATYDMYARMSKALKLEFDNVDDAIREIAGGELGDGRAAD
ncbi:MAG: carboxymuconolactone decarboxylase family protein [Actinomycetota bacterium]